MLEIGELGGDAGPGAIVATLMPRPLKAMNSGAYSGSAYAPTATAPRPPSTHRLRFSQRMPVLRPALSSRRTAFSICCTTFSISICPWPGSASLAGSETDSRSLRTAWAIFLAHRDTPGGRRAPFSAACRGLVWEGSRRSAAARRATKIGS